MRQLTLATAGFERYAKTTRRAVFLAEMESVVPWPALCGLIAPFYPKPGNGHPPIGVERMSRIYFVQQWFNLSDPGVEEALYDSLAMRRFVGIDLGREPAPDETTMCRFRHLLEEHDLGRRLFDEVQQHLAAKGLKVATGTIVDATIISAPSSTKNAAKARDPEMHQTKKGNQWYFGMKAHLGVDSRSKLIHAAVATPANVAEQGAARTAAWPGDPGVGRSGLSRSARGDPPEGVAGAGFHQPPVSPSRCHRRGRADEEPHQIEGARARSSIRSGSSSGCSALPKCATAGLRRTCTACLSPVRWPICSSSGDSYCSATRRSAPAMRGARRRRAIATACDSSPASCRLSRHLLPWSQAAESPLIQTFPNFSRAPQSSFAGGAVKHFEAPARGPSRCDQSHTASGASVSAQPPHV
jgi:hypothetical protein